MIDAPLVCLSPSGTRQFLADAIVAGGGTLAEPDHAEALVWADPSDPLGLRKMLDDHPNLRWVQLPWAGIEPYIDVLDADRVWTAGKGVYANEVAEHALGLALGLMRNIANYSRAKSWGPPEGTSLYGANVTILGAGGIAQSLVRLLEPFKTNITIVRRRDEPFEGVARTVRFSELDAVLNDTELLVLALALTPTTRNIIDKDRLALLGPSGWLVNVARGQHVVTDDLTAALRSGGIAGAALDVTDPEPLPDGHPLWSCSRCVITPHVANTPDMAKPVLMARVTENVRRFGAGEALLGVVDVEAGY